jgi:hypothetical protein
MSENTKTENECCWACADGMRDFDEVCRRKGAPVFDRCPNCGKPRPQPEPAMSEEERLAAELADVWVNKVREFHGEPLCHLDSLDQYGKCDVPAWLAVAARARALLATEPEPLTPDECGAIVDRIFGPDRSKPATAKWYDALDLVMEAADAQRRKQRPVAEPVDVAAIAVTARRHALTEAMLIVRQEGGREPTGDVKAIADRLSVLYDGPAPAKVPTVEQVAPGVQVVHGVKSVFSEPSPAPSQEVGTPALDELFDVNSPGRLIACMDEIDRVRDAYRSDTAALRERAENLQESISRLRGALNAAKAREEMAEQERDAARAKMAEAEAENARLRGEVQEARDMADRVEKVNREMAAKVAGKTGLPRVGDAVELSANMSETPGPWFRAKVTIDGWTTGFNAKDEDGRIRSRNYADEGKTWRRIPEGKE